MEASLHFLGQYFILSFWERVKKQKTYKTTKGIKGRRDNQQ
jgi:hypothetical protein